MSFYYMCKEQVVNPHGTSRLVAEDYNVFDQNGECLGFVRKLVLFSPHQWILVDDGMAAAKDRILERPAVADVCDLTQRLYMMAVLGVFSFQNGTADHPRFKNP